MATIKVNTAGVAALRQNAITLKSKADDCVQVISYARENIDMNTASAENIQSRLQSLQKRMQAQEDKLAKYAGFLVKVNDDFTAADRGISQKAKSVTYLADKVLVLLAADYQSRQTLNIVSQQQDYAKAAALFTGIALSIGISPTWLEHLKEEMQKRLVEFFAEMEKAKNPYTKADAGKKVADFTTDFYDSYMNGNSGGYKHQCVSYVYNRVREKYNLGDMTGSSFGKDVAATFKKWTDKGKSVNEDGTHYRVVKGGDGKKYKVQAYTDDKGEHIAADSWVSFNTGTKAGHVVYVESVQMEDGKKYVYYSEGGTNYHKNGTDGELKRKSYTSFMKLGTYSGCVSFTEIKS